eukprot:5852999-Ditylum_brightwellii.AAC.1
MSCKKIVRKVMLKADKKHTRQNIAYHYQDVFDFPPREEWKDLVNLLASYFELTKGQKQKVYCVFNHCEDDKSKGKLYDGERNSFICEKLCAINSSGIESQL